jgi:phosphoglycerate dehydrogenase-like enzyme
MTALHHLNMPKGIILLSADNFALIYGTSLQREIARRVDLVAGPVDAHEIRRKPHLLAEVEVIFGGWGTPPIDAAFLAKAPRLKAVFHGSGSIRYLVSEEFWARGIRITSSYAMNGLAVADYTVGAILFGLKRGFAHARYAQQHGRLMTDRSAPGTFGSVVGVISLGAAGRAVCERLKVFDLEVLAYDPFSPPETFAEVGARSVGLDELFTHSDVVTLHAPELPETVGLLCGAHFAAMKRNATFINTARGAVVREAEMISVLQDRPDLTAVLDVTEPEPPMPGSPLYTMPNVELTPHIAGAIGAECRRMGHCMVEEFDRWQRGEPMRWEITREKIVRMA